MLRVSLRILVKIEVVGLSGRKLWLFNRRDMRLLIMANDVLLLLLLGLLQVLLVLPLMMLIRLERKRILTTHILSKIIKTDNQ